MKDLISFDKLIVEKPRTSKNGFSTNYIIEMPSGTRKVEFRHKYEEDITSDNTQRFANLVSGVPAINHGLFAKEIIFDYSLSPQEYKFFDEMINRMSTEIFISRFYKDPVFIKKEFHAKKSDVTKYNTSSKAKFIADIVPDNFSLETNPNKIVVLSSGGKESLLCYGLLKQAGLEVFPVYINESGGHWKTALTAYKSFKENDKNTKRVWSNVDRVYSFLVKNSKVVERDIKGIKSITDPIHFFSFAHYVFSALPHMEKNKIGNICVGNEYDEPYDIVKADNQINNVKYFPGIYDQSQEFDEYMTTWFGDAGFNIKQWAPIRSITGFQVQKILGKKYPGLFNVQTSCHHTHVEDGKVTPCGVCQKCMRILSFCICNDIDYTKIGYSEKNKKYLAENAGKLKLGKEELEHTYARLKEHGIELQGDIRAKYHHHVEQMHFDSVSSKIENIPQEHRQSIYSILLSNSDGAVRLDNNMKWKPYNLERHLK